MTDELPESARALPIKPSLRIAHRIGAKCVVTELGDDWICAHGTDGTGRPEENGGSPAVALMGAIGVDPAQARVYYHPGKEDDDPKVLVVSPDSAPFRKSAKGRRPGHSISFDDTGSPVANVRLLYALKTGRYDDRLKALDLLPFEYWSDEVRRSESFCSESGISFGQIFDLMNEAALHRSIFTRIVGQLIVADSARRHGALSDWAQWEDVAQNAVKETPRLAAEGIRETDIDQDSLLLNAVRLATYEHQGLPAQFHVKSILVANRATADWNEQRTKLGFDWLPSLRDWKKMWPIKPLPPPAE